MKPRGCKMKRNFLIMRCLFFLLVLPGVVSADCTSVGPFDNFVVREDHTVILYNGSVALIEIEVDCSVQPKSKIRLLKNYCCDGDDILIDDSTCSIMSLKSLSED